MATMQRFSEVQYTVHFRIDFDIEFTKDTKIRIGDISGYKGLNSLVRGEVSTMVSEVRILDDLHNRIMEFYVSMELLAKASGVLVGGRSKDAIFVKSAMVKLINSYCGQTAWGDSTEIVAWVNSEELAGLIDYIADKKIAEIKKG